LVFILAGCETFVPPAPRAPSITLKVESATAITVSWNRVSGATGYEVSYGTQADDLSTTLEVAELSAEITGLTPNTTYYFSVKANNNGTWSDASAVKSAKTTPEEGTGDPVAGAPSWISATAETHGSVNLDWEVVKADLYYIYRSENQTDFTVVVASPPEPPYIDNADLKPGRTYYYRISAISSGVESDKSPVASATTPSMPDQVQVPDTSISGALSWLRTNAESGGAYTVEVDSDGSIGPAELSYNNKTNITITIKGSGSNRTIALTNRTDSLFTVDTGITLVLGPNITLTGIENNIKALVQVKKGAKLVMQEGAKITGNTYDYFNSRGGGVFVAGTFTMEGGEISGNTAKTSTRSAYGGGVYVDDSATFVMNGGKISGNTVSSSSGSSTTASPASPFGGGVYIRGGAVFIMNGGEISGNSVNSGVESAAYGGGVSTDGIFTMNGGKISGNRVTASRTSAYGGGIYTASAFTMKGGEISDNRAASTSPQFIACGGGIYVAGVFLMSGGKISGNTANATVTAAYGGGIYTENTFMLEDGEISGNTVSSSSVETPAGGGVYAKGEFLMAKGKISGNTASSTQTSVHGAGVYAEGEFTMYDGEISANVLNSPNASIDDASCGAGVFLTGSFTLEGGEIKANAPSSATAVSMGGGVFVYDEAQFTVYGGTMSGNSASYGGGVYVNGTGVFSKTSYGVGGSIYGNDDSALKNIAANGDGYGHVVYVYKGSVDGSTDLLYRDTTAGPADRLDSNVSGNGGGWE
jgi:hypothetical protein